MLTNGISYFGASKTYTIFHYMAMRNEKLEANCAKKSQEMELKRVDG